MKTIAITLGDPGGIGPEVSLKALYQNHWPATLRFVLIGSRTILRRQAAQLRLPLPPVWQLADGKNNTERIVNWEPEHDLELGRRGGNCYCSRRTLGRRPREPIVSRLQL